ncbi:hypothetical protein, partial [Pseudomonas syringae group genomosp. 7]|uniref:hypothetical protein n=1 Tax=Pseudomonas syringae group genomosp. 7 TaxID=251699 RepID=UPI00376F7C0D
GVLLFVFGVGFVLGVLGFLFGCVVGVGLGLGGVGVCVVGEFGLVLGLVFVAEGRMGLIVAWWLVGMLRFVIGLGAL